MDSNSFFTQLLMSQNPTIPFICPCLRPADTSLQQLDPNQFHQLKADGKFLHSIRSYACPVDLSIHVAAQNGFGWQRDGNVFKPVGTSHATCVLKHSSFSIHESDFMPVATPAQAPVPKTILP